MAQSQFTKSVMQDSFGSFKCIALPPVRLQKGKTNIWVGQRVTYDEPTNTDGLACFLQGNQIQAKTMLRIRGHQLAFNLLLRIF